MTVTVTACLARHIREQADGDAPPPCIRVAIGSIDPMKVAAAHSGETPRLTGQRRSGRKKWLHNRHHPTCRRLHDPADPAAPFPQACTHLIWVNGLHEVHFDGKGALAQRQDVLVHVFTLAAKRARLRAPEYIHPQAGQICLRGTTNGDLLQTQDLERPRGAEQANAGAKHQSGELGD